MVVEDELPFWFVEGEVFQAYSKYLEPRFKIPSRHTVTKDIMKLYSVYRELLRMLFSHLFFKMSVQRLHNPYYI